MASCCIKVFFIVVMSCLLKTNAETATRAQLHLLALVPLGNTGDPTTPCVDRGEELLPAAQIAADAVNTNLFNYHNFELKIVPVQTTRCNDDSFSLSLASFVQQLTNKSLTPVGVIGMVCSSVVRSVSPFASHPGVNILQITSGTVSIAQSEVDINLFQTASPSTLYNDAVIALMKHNKWKRLVLIRHSGSFFEEHNLIAEDLRTKIDKNDSMSINESHDFEVDSGTDDIDYDRILKTIYNGGDRIIYASVTLEEARFFLCRTSKSEQDVRFPRNQWIFHSHTVDELLRVESIDNCTSKDIESALRGVLLLQYRLQNNQSSTENLTLTNSNYKQYLDQYKQQLNELNTENNETVCDKGPRIIYANALYDSVIAFSLAINNSLESVTQEQFRKYGIRDNTTDVTTAIRENLEKLPTFIGASGAVNFDPETHEVEMNTDIDVCIVDNNEVSPVFRYIRASDLIHKFETANNISVRQGEFDDNPILIELGLSVTAFVLVLILVTVHTAVLLLFIYYWNSPDIKATSPVLSVVMLIACYMLDLSILITTIRYRFASGQVLESCCAAENWFLFIGLQLIFATLLMRLIRVYRIFFHYTKLGNLWSDYSLLAFIMLWVSVGVVILIIWMAADAPKERVDRFFQATKAHFDLTRSCTSKYINSFPVWIGLLLLYTGIMMIIVVVLAVSTRKVKIESFKDTRTVNGFIYTTIICFGVLITLSFISEFVGDQTVAFVIRVLALTIVAVACVCFLFLPKIYAAQCQKDPASVRRKSTTLSTPTFPSKIR